MTKAELGYLAGIVDGDGTIAIRESLPSRWRGLGYHAQLSVWNTSLTLMSWLTATWGGTIRPKRPSALSKKPLYQWQIGGYKAENVIAQILAYLLVKRRNAENVRG